MVRVVGDNVKVLASPGETLGVVELTLPDEMDGSVPLDVVFNASPP